MLAVAVLLFFLGAFFGGWMAVAIFQDKRPPREIVYTHGGLVVAALAIVLYYVFTTDGPKPIASVVFFLLAAAGGIFMYVMESAGVRPPRAVVIIHPILAVSGLVLLILFTLTQAA